MTAIRCLALLIVLLAIAAGAGIAGCKILGADVHRHDLILAVSVALTAAIIAAIPLLVQAGRLDTAGAFQASLIGSVLHLGIVLLAALVLLMLKRATTPFVLWLLAAYWATLIGLCLTFARLIRSAPKVGQKLS